jgi:hypothetical protein
LGFSSRWSEDFRDVFTCSTGEWVRVWTGGGSEAVELLFCSVDWLLVLLEILESPLANGLQLAVLTSFMQFL